MGTIPSGHHSASLIARRAVSRSLVCRWA
jgi:hypothetical protein